jgi:uroporphyrinogen-III synthase
VRSLCGGSVPAYATRAVLKGNEVEEALLKGGEIDAIAFSSTAEATALALSLGGPERLREAVRNTVVCCFGPVTAKNVRDDLGLEVQVVSKNFSSFAGYADALVDHFSANR